MEAIASSSKDATFGAPGIATRNNDASRVEAITALSPLPPLPPVPPPEGSGLSGPNTMSGQEHRLQPASNGLSST